MRDFPFPCSLRRFILPSLHSQVVFFRVTYLYGFLRDTTRLIQSIFCVSFKRPPRSPLFFSDFQFFPSIDGSSPPMWRALLPPPRFSQLFTLRHAPSMKRYSCSPFFPAVNFLPGDPSCLGFFFLPQCEDPNLLRSCLACSFHLGVFFVLPSATIVPVDHCVQPNFPQLKHFLIGTLFAPPLFLLEPLAVVFPFPPT